MPRPSNTAERQAQIVDALLVVMAKHGYEGASVGLIAKQAGLASGLVHYHFESKQAILVALVTRLTDSVNARYDKRIQHAASAREKLDALIDAHLELDDESDPRSVAAWNVIGAEALRQTEVRRLYCEGLARAHVLLKKHVVQCLRDARRPTRHAGRIASGLLAAIEGSFRVAATSPDLISRGSASAMVKHMANRLLAGEAS